MTAPTQARPDYYEVLGVSRTATQQEIKDAFGRLTAEFHAAGKPKNINDVEWLRTVARAYRTLNDSDLRKHYDHTGDDTVIPPAHPAGYDQELLEQWNRRVDFEAKLQRNIWLAHFAAGILTDIL
jgi:DnaJ-class molecular chaperone